MTHRFLAITSVLALSTPAAHAHRLWLVASTTVLSGTNQHISVEGAISNNLFSPNHLSLPLSATSATAPSGRKLELLSPAEGKIRSSFELLLNEAGTYWITSINDMMFLSWKVAGETRHDRGTPAEMARRDFGTLSEPEISRWISRVETVVTCGAPTPIKPTGKGLEFGFVTHPNDLFHGESATFRVLLDGKPLPGAKVSVVKGDDRFRDEVDELTVTSDADGMIKIDWPSPGRFWLSAEAEQAPGVFKDLPLERGAAYFLTLDVLPQ